jgi:5-formyltetrahydrofolate cyclo-ligase
MEKAFHETKENLRVEILSRRQGIGEQAAKASDLAIAARLLSFEPFRKAGMVFLYASTPGEVDTEDIIRKALGLGKRVCLPRCYKLGEMDAFEIESLKDLQTGRYGILEPAARCRLVPKEELALAVIPCVSCTKQGKRLGYGGGFYDRYLIHRDYPAVVLCREALLLEDIPTLHHDVVMDAVITETETLITA